MPETGLSDEGLRDQIRAVKRDEEAISYERRLLHGRIDVVRSEILARLAGGRPEAASDEDALNALVKRLSDALTHQGPPPIEAELARFGHADDPAGDEGSLADELPDLATLSDAELAALVRTLEIRERRTSARRQELHRELDRLRTDHVARLQQKYAADAGE